MQYISQFTERDHYCETIPAAKTLENNGEYGGREYYQIFPIKGTTCKIVQLFVTYSETCYEYSRNLSFHGHLAKLF